MSYDIYLRGPLCPTCQQRGDEPDGPLPSPEVSEGQAVIFRAPTARPRGLRVLSGRLASETVEQLTAALERLESRWMRPQFEAIEWPGHTWEIR